MQQNTLTHEITQDTCENIKLKYNECINIRMMQYTHDDEIKNE